MTNEELHNLVDILLDKFQAPWFDADEKDRFLNLALMEYVKENYSKFELNEKVKQNIVPLVRSIRVKGPTSTFSTDTLPNFMFFLNMNGFFNDPDCNRSVKDVEWEHDSSSPNTLVPTTDAHPLKPGRANLVTKTTDTTLADTIRRSIQPTQLDDISSSFGDPFNEPTDEYPLYVTRADHKGHQFVQIYSDTEPLFVDVDYLTEPPAIDGENDPTGVSIMPLWTHEEIVNIAVRKMLDNIESPRYATQLREVQEQIN